MLKISEQFIIASKITEKFEIFCVMFCGSKMRDGLMGLPVLFHTVLQLSNQMGQDGPNLSNIYAATFLLS